MIVAIVEQFLAWVLFPVFELALPVWMLEIFLEFLRPVLLQQTKGKGTILSDVMQRGRGE